MKTVKDLFGITRRVISKWSDDAISTQAAALAYYTIFSIAPMLLIAVAIAGSVFGVDAAHGEIHRQLKGLLGSSAAEAVEELVRNAWRERHGVLATTLGVVALVFGATGVFVQLQDTLNVIWKAPPRPSDRAGIRAFIHKRILSFAMVLALGFLLLVSLVGSAIVSALMSRISLYLPSSATTLLEIGNVVIPFAVAAVLFSLIFMYLPDRHVRWRYCWPGGILAAGLFAIGKQLIGLYLGQSAVASSFGAAGSLAVLLVWVYYTSQIVLIGAELTSVLGRPPETKGSAVSPRAILKR